MKKISTNSLPVLSSADSGWENWKILIQPIDGKKRKIEQIPVEEMAVAVEWIVSQSFSIDEDGLYREIASLLSVSRWITFTAFMKT